MRARPDSTPSAWRSALAAVLTTKRWLALYWLLLLLTLGQLYLLAASANGSSWLLLPVSFLPAAALLAGLGLLAKLMQADRSDDAGEARILGTGLLAARSLSILVFLLLPLVATQLACLRLLGLPVAAMPAAAGTALVWVGPVVVLGMLVAVLTPDLVRFTLGAVGLLLCFRILMAVASAVFAHRWGEELGRHLADSWRVLVLLAAVVTAAGLLLYRYQTRRRGPVAGVAAVLLTVLLLSIIPWTGGLFWAGPESHSPPPVRLRSGEAPPQARESEAAVTADGDIQLLLRPEMSRRPAATYYTVLETALSFRFPDGGRLKLEADPLGARVGIGEALPEALRAAGLSSGKSLHLSPEAYDGRSIGVSIDAPTFADRAQEEAVLQGRMVLEERRLRVLPSSALETPPGSWSGAEQLLLDGSRRVSDGLLLLLDRGRLAGVGPACDVWLVADDPKTDKTYADRIETTRSQGFDRALPLPMNRPSVRRHRSEASAEHDTASQTSALKVTHHALLEDCPVGRRSALLSEARFRMGDYAEPEDASRASSQLPNEPAFARLAQAGHSQSDS